MRTTYQATSYSKPSLIVNSEAGQDARVALSLTETQLGQILDALADYRDPYGDEASPLEDSLRTALTNLRGFKAQA